LEFGILNCAGGALPFTDEYPLPAFLAFLCAFATLRDAKSFFVSFASSWFDFWGEGVATGTSLLQTFKRCPVGKPDLRALTPIPTSIPTPTPRGYRLRQRLRQRQREMKVGEIATGTSLLQKVSGMETRPTELRARPKFHFGTPGRSASAVGVWRFLQR